MPFVGTSEIEVFRILPRELKILNSMWVHTVEWRWLNITESSSPIHIIQKERNSAADLFSWWNIEMTFHGSMIHIWWKKRIPLPRIAGLFSVHNMSKTIFYSSSCFHQCKTMIPRYSLPIHCIWRSKFALSFFSTRHLSQHSCFGHHLFLLASWIITYEKREQERSCV